MSSGSFAVGGDAGPARAGSGFPRVHGPESEVEEGTAAAELEADAAEEGEAEGVASFGQAHRKPASSAVTKSGRDERIWTTCP